jgi:hypothetical protein
VRTPDLRVGPFNNELQGVAAVSARSVWAVGDDLQPFVLHCGG